MLVSNLNDVGLRPAESIVPEEGFGVLGEAFSIAAAYAFESVLKAVGEVGSMSPFSAVEDLPRVKGVDDVLICRDSLGLFAVDFGSGGGWSDIVTDGVVASVPRCELPRGSSTDSLCWNKCQPTFVERSPTRDISRL